MFSLISITILLSLVGVNGQNLHNFDYLINQALPFLKDIQKVSLDSPVCPQANNTALLACFSSYYKNYNFPGVNSTDNKLVDATQLLSFVKNLTSSTTDQQNFNAFTKCYTPLSQCLYVSNLATIVETSAAPFNEATTNAEVYAIVITAGEFYYQNPASVSAFACADKNEQQIANSCGYTTPKPSKKFILDKSCTDLILNLDQMKYYCFLSAFATTCNASSEAGTLCKTTNVAVERLLSDNTCSDALNTACQDETNGGWTGSSPNPTEPPTAPPTQPKNGAEKSIIKGWFFLGSVLFYILFH